MYTECYALGNFISINIYISFRDLPNLYCWKMLGCVGQMQLKDISNIFTKYNLSIIITSPKGCLDSLDILGIDHFICGDTLWLSGSLFLREILAKFLQ